MLITVELKELLVKCGLSTLDLRSISLNEVQLRYGFRTD